MKALAIAATARHSHSTPTHSVFRSISKAVISLHCIMAVEESLRQSLLMPYLVNPFVHRAAPIPYVQAAILNLPIPI